MSDKLRVEIANYLEKQLAKKLICEYLQDSERFQYSYNHEDLIKIADVIIPMVKGQSTKYIKILSDKNKAKKNIKKQYSIFINDYNNMKNNTNISQPDLLLYYIDSYDTNANPQFLRFSYNKLHKFILNNPKYYSDIEIANFIMTSDIHKKYIPNYDLIINDIDEILIENYGHTLEETCEILKNIKV